MFSKKYNNQQGFTLIELLVTISVITILAAMAAPSFSNMVAKQRLNSSTRELALTLTQARSQAALLRREVTVTLNSSTPNTASNFYWNPTSNNSLSTSPSTTPPMVFTANGTMKDITTGAFPETSFIICNSKSRTTKTIILTRMGTQSVGSEGTC